MALRLPPGGASARSCDLAHVHASAHREELASSNQCACYFCFRTFGFADIVRWTDGNQTALCPKCGIDAVLGDASGFAIDERFLRRMHDHWFTMKSKR
jgi:hypothetical protein